jgi:hypothetical protein
VIPEEKDACLGRSLQSEAVHDFLNRQLSKTRYPDRDRFGHRFFIVPVTFVVNTVRLHRATQLAIRSLVGVTFRVTSLRTMSTSSTGPPGLSSRSNASA